MSGNKKKESSKSEFSMVARGISMILQIGISMMVPIALCLFIGIQIDKCLSTGWFVLVFLFLGFAAGIKSVHSITKGFYAKDLAREDKEQRYFADLYKERDKSIAEKDTKPHE